MVKAEEHDKDNGMSATWEAEEEIGLDPFILPVSSSWNNIKTIRLCIYQSSDRKAKLILVFSGCLQEMTAISYMEFTELRDRAHSSGCLQKMTATPYMKFTELRDSSFWADYKT